MRVHAVHDTENPPTLRCPCGAEAGLNVPLGVYDCRFPPPLAGGEGERNLGTDGAGRYERML